MSSGGATITDQPGSYLYDLNGNLRSWSLTGRATSLHVYSYDELNRLTTLTRQNFTEPMTWNYATDKVGRKTTDGTKFRWEYDALGRLTKEQYDANTNWTLDSANDYITTFAYDLVGNRKKKVTDKLGTASDETVTYVYNSRDELTSETSTLSGSTTYVYDANGSLTSKTKGAAVETYGYDKRNKMTSYTSPTGVITSYKYDDEGLRVQRKVGTAAATLYLLNHHNLTGYAVVMEERSGTPTSMPVVAYVVGHDVVRQSQDAAGTGTTDGHLHLVYDGQGNMRGNVGTINVGPTTIFATVGGTRDYTAFGELISGSLVSNLRHHGEYFDGMTGFYFQGVRQRVTHWWTQMDDPRVGRNIEPLTLHKYGFVHQDPINGTDPTGMWSKTEILTTTAIVGALIGALGGAGVAAYKGYKVTEARFWGWTLGGALTGAAIGYASGLILIKLGLLSVTGAGAAAPPLAQATREGYANHQQVLNAWRQQLGSWSSDLRLHHLVEQGGNNVTRFGNQAIHSLPNTTPVPSLYHQAISSMYGSGPMVNQFMQSDPEMRRFSTLRAWMQTQPWDVQWRWGYHVYWHVLQYGSSTGFDPAKHGL